MGYDYSPMLIVYDDGLDDNYLPLFMWMQFSTTDLNSLLVYIVSNLSVTSQWNIALINFDLSGSKNL